MKIGDKVAVLDDVISGRITGIDHRIITIETPDGFELDFNKEELVLLDNSITKREMALMDAEQVWSQKNEGKKRTGLLKKSKKEYIPALEVDLHIHHLVQSTRFLAKHDMLNIQLDTAQRQLEFAISKRFQRVIFIHGVGEGVLRAELETLFRRYDNIKFYDADYQKYGRGATEVYIFQNPQKGINDPLL